MIHLLRVALWVCVLCGVAAGQAEPVVVQLANERGREPAHPVPLLGFGGGVWHTPRVMPVLAPRMLELTRPGLLRPALAWEVLAASDGPDDIPRRLREYRLNAFLKAYKARGGEILVCLDAMPRWLAADRSDKRLADGPAWAKSPPRDYDAWRKLVQQVVQHFNGELGLDARYEVWNEPDHAWAGTLDQYLQLYRATAAGALAADPKAKVGGPALSDWSATGPRGTRGGAAGGFFFQRLFDYAARTPLPELGRRRLPVDFVSWHSFYRDPARHYEFIAPQLRGWLRAAGFPAETPLIVSEWNIAAEPPYPEGDLNGSHVGAAYVVSNVLAMHRNGVDRQVFQMLVDPGAKGYSGGAFTPAGLPRANFQAFRLLSMIQGRDIATSSSDPWVSSLAAEDGSRLYVLVSCFVPTERTLMRSTTEQLPARHPELTDRLAQHGSEPLVAFFRSREPARAARPGEPDPAPLVQARDVYQRELQKARQWPAAQALEIRLPAGFRPRRQVLRYAIDARRSPSASTLQAADDEIQAALVREAQASMQDLRSRDLGPDALQEFENGLRASFGSGPIAGPPATQQALRAEFDRLHALLARLLDAKMSSPAFSLWSERFEGAALETGRLRTELLPNSVQLFVFERD